MNNERGENRSSPKENAADEHSMTPPRGETRPGMHHEGGGHAGGEMEMSREDRLKMLEKHHRATLWVPALTVVLAVWLIFSSLTYGYASTRVAWSDLVAGAAVIVLAVLWIKRPRWFWVRWVLSLVGFWLLLAPLVFWAGNPAAYAVNTFVGAMVIALAILVPGMPAMLMIMKMGPDTPPGWTYNPSSWLQRAPVIALGFVGFFLSSYLAAFQLGYTSSVWDPFFSGRQGMNGTATVLTSDISKAWPVSDAGFGAVSYMLEALMGFMGGEARWRTMPWMVTFFGILVIPLGATSIVLVIMQPLAVGAWCTVCLATAAAMLVMIPLTLDEVWAMGQFLVQSKREGKPFWRTFFKGGTVEEKEPEGRARRENPALTAPAGRSLPAMVWGVSLPWNLVLSVTIGLWLMFAPAVFGTSGTAADSNHLVGALIVTWTVIVTAEVARAGRFLNVLFGLWIAAAPFVLTGAGTGATANNLICGLLIAVLALPRGRVRDGYGGWNAYIV